jgi:GrpB-like predicted nucleotidyltransferase (UPF0157 family)
MINEIIVVPYDSEWPNLFQTLGYSLRKALGDIALRIDHIGSTSIRGLDAKPIIDLQISVASFDPVEAISIPLQKNGFYYRSDNADLTKRYFREAPGDRRTHIHVRQTGSWSEQFALLFRDYMRCHPTDCNIYAQFKHQLAEQFQNNRHGYVAAKTPFIWETIRKADEWAQETGWSLGKSDA